MTAMDYAPKQVVPGTQYRIVRMIGAGGHGSVYAVEHTFLEAPAVMKILHGDLVGEGSLATRMMREARTLAKLRHPNIVEVRDGGLTSENPPRPFFVMEALKGMPLREMIRQVPQGLGMLPSLQIAIGVLNGLHYAHSAGVVHRDIKPDNIFLHKAGDVTVPKILDFGIAHLFLGKNLTGRNFLGTPRYASPEQIRGEPPSASTDIYAAGLVLYEMLTGEAPFAHLKELVEICTAHCETPLPPVSRRVPGAPKALDDFVSLMLAKNPQDRPPTAFAAAVGLRELRAMIEKAQSKSIQSPDFKTEPTPMENALVELGPDGQPMVAESIRRPMAESAVHDTIVQAPDFDTIRNPALSATEPATPERPQGIDRNAPTRSSPRDKPMARRIANFDTHVTDIPPESAPPSPRALVSSQRGRDPTPGAVAMPPASADISHPAGVPRPRSVVLPIVLAGGATIAVLTAITIPIALRFLRGQTTSAAAPAGPASTAIPEQAAASAAPAPSPAPPEPAPEASASPEATTTASAPAAVEPPPRRVISTPVRTAAPPPPPPPPPPPATTAVAAPTTAAPKTTAKKPPPPKPGDPSAIGFD